VPLITGSALSLLVTSGGTDPSPEVQASLATVFAVLWYFIARLLEMENRYWGILLAVAVEPHYDDKEEPEAVLGMSLRRTVIPLVAGWAITYLVKVGADIDHGVAGLWLQGLITTLYYGAIRFIEMSKPKAGILIGGVAPPTY